MTTTWHGVIPGHQHSNPNPCILGGVVYGVHDSMPCGIRGGVCAARPLITANTKPVTEPHIKGMHARQ